ncbi:class I poly(R)-hydroxyalkanoic acid synthase [Rubellimicrobium sp. CFH 75288]|uniref:class I poly(R)-hydroxyalkanoic acid synthase n=1 Tax=Rubellimicrobium sp. CFH 75288 TaxID=2697034 RepID=UPI001413774D|nr:class I poly(R)-hydroxyalkanoic acid synthase [Rubellimicrobium sp. CFH 75288]NAZ36273.1 class I poly(R)-hydroxyalkanoic acid synthase [Rubellimicrobium sp. CFH 75288]
MATEQKNDPPEARQEGRNLETFERNLRRIEDLSARLVSVMAQRRHVPPALQGPSPDLYVKAAQAWMAEAMANPARLIAQQAGYWTEALRHFSAMQAAFVPGAGPAPEAGPRDRRFANPLWDTHPWFAAVKHQYLLNSEAVARAVDSIEGLSEREKTRLRYFSRQMVDLLAPTNFLATNPDALERALETDGQSLVDGLENLVRDLEAHGGELIVRLADDSAFRLGENIATTPGEVVFRNRLFELIQYAPSTETVHQIPLVIFPPWINKFYILDLKPQNSLVKWIVDQGFTLFMVSWVNPDPSYRDTTLGDYVAAYLEATDRIRTICGTDRVNVVGYCIAGTTLALALALLARRGDRRVQAATFLTTLTDFSDPGEMGVFLENDFVDALEREAGEKGILESFYMARTFSYLRSNDLIYAPAIRSYMLGETPPAFDLLYWNGDGTNLPAAMAVEYLRGLCQQDRFARDGFPVLGETVHLSDVDVPLCAVACQSDHIAAWTSSWRGVRAMGATDKTFILSESGHIAGIVNPPSKGKYGHWTNPDWPDTPEEWLAGAEKHAGSWWPRWGDWLAGRSGPRIPAREPGGPGHEPLGPAPGRYVAVSAPPA